ncbi:hypothetical protein CesoFtcFv8_000288, partial [Champsocephalus esox]
AQLNSIRLTLWYLNLNHETKVLQSTNLKMKGRHLDIHPQLSLDR